jgi:hypothetical protein
MARQRTSIYSAVDQRVRAARAFHAGLIAETQRHLDVLRGFDRLIDVLRHPEHRLKDKLKAADESWRQLRRLERLKDPWRTTYADLRQSLHTIRLLLRRAVKPAANTDRRSGAIRATGRRAAY